MPPAAVLRARLAARGARGRSGSGGVPGAEREGRPALRSTSRRSGASSRRAPRTRRGGVSTGPAPPAGLGPRHLHPRPLGRGSENTVPPRAPPPTGRRPAPRAAPAPPIAHSGAFLECEWMAGDPTAFLDFEVTT
ncbi:cbp/p300-interacting transactivator 4-like [Eubalaena glacialis]|uniref:cbp/p300-interacting transactivator 4-like n=1 Tax=Eubalaena glacialis TaxID=27606 RepID=UPI002A5A831B|nr:cbp/p300-interacting transactivator 4-like [Eubalaena glacialis]